MLLGVFKETSSIIHAVEKLREAGQPIHDAYTPFAVHGLDEAMGLKRSRLTFVALAAGLTGVTAGFSLEYFTMVIDWPVIIGAKPHFSLPAFVPVMFEATILITSLTIAGTFLLRSKLLPVPKIQVLEDLRVTDDQFVLAVDTSQKGFNAATCKEIFKKYHATEVIERKLPKE